MHQPNKAIVVGVGPQRGLGFAIADLFATKGYHVFLAGRSRERLSRLAEVIVHKGGSATPVVTDATREADILRLFETAQGDGTGSINVAIYNVGVNQPGRIAEMSAETFERTWRLGSYGGFLFGREAARQMLPGGGTLIFTGASASLRGRAGFGAFNSAKAALRALAQAMAKEYGQEGLHVAHVVVDGGIHGDFVRENWPEFAAERGDEGLIALSGLAEVYWQLHAQQCRAWTFEIDVRTYRESW
jgi:NAD(P)-dependent dehydrogenase (short-subunit alcohol dehydrogenase family)